jgi:hypothetical protein
MQPDWPVILFLEFWNFLHMLNARRFGRQFSTPHVSNGACTLVARLQLRPQAADSALWDTRSRLSVL